MLLYAVLCCAVVCFSVTMNEKLHQQFRPFGEPKKAHWAKKQHKKQNKGKRKRQEHTLRRHRRDHCCAVLYPGLGLCFGLDSLEAPGATGSYDSHFASKAATAAAALVSGGYDFVMLHVKAVDDTGHDRMLSMKVGCLAACYNVM